jgi:hypothetical protein
MLDFTRSAVAPTPAAANQAAPAQERPKADIWMNLGQLVDEDGEEVFVSIPTGVAIDTMSPNKVGNPNSKMGKRLRLGNKFHQQLIEKGSDLEPGETVYFTIVAELRRVNTDESRAATAEPLNEDVSIFGPVA